MYKQHNIHITVSKPAKIIKTVEKMNENNNEGDNYYTRRQINQDRMILSDFSVNSEPIVLKFCKGHFLFKS